MIYGPFSLADAADAKAEFLAWSELEDDFDSLFVGASINGSNFFGSTLTVDFDWTCFVFDLTNVLTLGDLTGQPIGSWGKPKGLHQPDINAALPVQDTQAFATCP